MDFRNSGDVVSNSTATKARIKVSPEGAAYLINRVIQGAVATTFHCALY